MKKYIVVGLLVMSFIISPIFVSAQTPQPDQTATLIRLLQNLIQLLQQQLMTLRGIQPLSPQQRADILRNLQNPSSVTVLSPNGGENFGIGSSKSVTWRGNVSTLSLLKYPYVLDCMSGPDEEGTRGCSPNPNVQYNIVEFPNTTVGPYVWKIDTVPSGSYVMLACNGQEYSDTRCDISDLPFDIVLPAITVLSPNGGETFKTGNQIGLAYDIRNIPSADTLSIQLKKMSGSSSTQIIADTPSNSFREAYWWTIPATFPIGNDYKITIYAKDSTGKIVAQDSSDTSFTIER